VSDVRVVLPKIEASIELAGSGDAPAPKPSFDPSPFRSAVEQYRTTARWVVGAFGAVGAIVAGSIPFAAISGVEQERLAWAVVGAALALLGVGAAIGSVTASLVPRSVYPHEVTSQDANRVQRWLSARRAVGFTLCHHPKTLLPVGVTSSDALLDGIVNLEQEILRDPSNEALTKRKSVYDAAYSQLQWILRFEKARRAFDRALAATVVAALVTGAGIGMLLWSVEDAKSEADVAKTEAEAAKTRAEAAKTRQEVQAARRRQAVELAKLRAERAKLAAEAAQARAEAAKTRAEVPAAGTPGAPGATVPAR
jgi:hypothetical protein